MILRDVTLTVPVLVFIQGPVHISLKCFAFLFVGASFLSLGSSYFLFSFSLFSFEVDQCLSALVTWNTHYFIGDKENTTYFSRQYVQNTLPTPPTFFELFFVPSADSCLRLSAPLFLAAYCTSTVGNQRFPAIIPCRAGSIYDTVETKRAFPMNFTLSFTTVIRGLLAAWETSSFSEVAVSFSFGVSERTGRGGFFDRCLPTPFRQ